jgi:hypothetical protein
MRHRIHLAVRVGLVFAGMIVAEHPVVASPQDERATQLIADMAASHIKTQNPGTIADNQLDTKIKDSIGELLKTVPSLGEQYKDAAALNGLLAKAKEKLKKLNNVPTFIAPNTPPPPKPAQPQNPAEQPQKPGEQPQKPAEQPQKTTTESNGPYFKDHPDWLEDAKKLLTKADRALASVLVTDSASDQAFKLKPDKRAEELKNWVQHEGRFANDPYFLDSFLQKKVGKKVLKLGDEDMKALEPAIREITKSTDAATPAASAGASTAGPLPGNAGSAAGTGSGAASSSVETSTVSSSADLAGDEVILVKSKPRIFQGLFTRVRTLSAYPLERRYIIVDE